MRQITIKSRDGRIRSVDIGSFDGDPNALLKDGETLVIPMVFMDAVSQRGYQSFADDAVTDADRQRVEDARSEMISKTSNRWKHAVTVRPTPHQDVVRCHARSGTRGIPTPAHQCLEEAAMNYSNLPASVLAKLLALEQIVEHLRDEEASLTPQINDIRNRLNGRVLDQRDDAGRLEQDMQRLVADHTQVKARLHQAQRLLSSCRTWLDRLPPGAKLEPVTASTEGKSLPEVRARISDAREELAKLKRAPVPSPDLRDRVERRIAALGAPTVRGIGAGEELKIVWPGAKQTPSGPDERSCEPLAMFAMLFPKKLADAVMTRGRADGERSHPRRPASRRALPHWSARSRS